MSSQRPVHRRERFAIAPVSPQMRGYFIDIVKASDKIRDKYQLDSFEDATPEIDAELHRLHEEVRRRHGIPPLP